jgi:hypothetical protein
MKTCKKTSFKTFGILMGLFMLSNGAMAQSSQPVEFPEVFSSASCTGVVVHTASTNEGYGTVFIDFDNHIFTYSGFGTSSFGGEDPVIVLRDMFPQDENGLRGQKYEGVGRLNIYAAVKLLDSSNSDSKVKFGTDFESGRSPQRGAFQAEISFGKTPLRGFLDCYGKIRQELLEDRSRR